MGNPGHPLFEVVREDVLERVQDHLNRGAVFWDLNIQAAGILDVFAASIKDGLGNTLHRRIFVVETDPDGEMQLRQPTYFLDITPKPADETSAQDPNFKPPDRVLAERFLFETALQPWLNESAEQREKEVGIIAHHVGISLNALIDRQQIQLADYLNRQIDGQTVTGLDGLIAQAEQHLDDLNNRLENRNKELEMERHCTIGDIAHLGRAIVVPHPERQTTKLAPMVRDEKIEKIAVHTARNYEEARGCVVESVEADTGDLI